MNLNKISFFALVTVTIAVLTIIYLEVFMINNNEKKERVLRFGLESDGWGLLNPAEQSSLNGHIIITNVFESLVGADEFGGYVPNLSTSWDINDDMSEYIFNIDTKRRFSDGSFLTTKDVKNSFEHSARQMTTTTSKSTLDFLYLLRGFDYFQKLDTLAGLEVLNDKQIKFSFTKPFRRAIDQLSGTRYAIYKIVNKQYIGTGPYKFIEVKNNYAKLTANEFYPMVPSVQNLEIVKGNFQQISKDELDLLLNPNLSAVTIKREGIESQRIGSLMRIHQYIYLNSMPTRIFSDKNLRKAAQYIIYNYIKTFGGKSDSLPPFYKYDNQFYEPLAPGRLADQEAETIIVEGQKYIDDLVKKSRENKISFIIPAGTNENNPYITAFDKYNVRVEVIEKPFSDIQKIRFRTFDCDIMCGKISGASADPDGLYHFLGINGALRSQLTSNIAVEQLLEEGRSIIDYELLHSHYKKVSRAILNEVPVIHTSTGKLFYVYNKKIEPVNPIFAKRTNLNLSLFQWR